MDPDRRQPFQVCPKQDGRPVEYHAADRTPRYTRMINYLAKAAFPEKMKVAFSEGMEDFRVAISSVKLFSRS